MSRTILVDQTKPAGSNYHDDGNDIDAGWSPRATLLFVVGTNLFGWAAIVVSASMLFR